MRKLLQFCNIPLHILNKLAPYTLQDAKQAIQKSNLQLLAHILHSGIPRYNEDDNLLIIALTEGKEDAALFLIEQFPHLLQFNRRNSKGDSPLMLAIFKKMRRTVLALIPKCDLNACDFRRNTPFIAAAANGDIQTLVLLAQNQNCNTTIRNIDGQSALHRACYFGELAVVDWLLENTALKVGEIDKRGCNSLHLACEGLNIALTRYLMKKVKNSEQLLTPNKEGKRPLQLLQKTIQSVGYQYLSTVKLDHLRPSKIVDQ